MHALEDDEISLYSKVIIPIRCASQCRSVCSPERVSYGVFFSNIFSKSRYMCQPHETRNKHGKSLEAYYGLASVRFIFVFPKRKPLCTIDALFSLSELETGLFDPHRFPRVERSLRHCAV